jgi:acylphosphatase
MATQQRIVHFSGTVQGVGFRFTACRVAKRHDVTGYVRNLANGRVECVVEGDEQEIDAFLGELGERMREYISGREAQTAPYTGRFSRFDVAF